jgi:N-acyl-D-amino-acid deacylase
MKATLVRNRQPNFSFAVIASFKADHRLDGKTIPEAAKLLRGSDTIDDEIETMLDIEARVARRPSSMAWMKPTWKNSWPSR